MLFLCHQHLLLQKIYFIAFYKIPRDIGYKKKQQYSIKKQQKVISEKSFTSAFFGVELFNLKIIRKKAGKNFYLHKQNLKCEGWQE